MTDMLASIGQLTDLELVELMQEIAVELELRLMANAGEH